MPPTHSVFHTLEIADIEPLTEDSVALTFRVPEDLAEEYRFTHGQHLIIQSEAAGDDVRRSFSICTPPSSGLLRIGVKRLPGGAFSDHALSRLQPGDTLRVMTPSGRFHTPLDPEQAKHYCCVAAGSGITPVLSIITAALETEPDSAVTLIYANRTHKTVMFSEEVEDLKNRYPGRFHLIHVFSREPREVELFSGRLDTDRMQRFLDTLIPPETVDEWFLCGPYLMVADLRKLLVSEGVSKKRLHAEVFHVDKSPAPRRTTPPEQQGEGADVTISLDGRQASFKLAGDGPPVLDAALEVRADAPFACRGGVCGTCRAKLVEGTVEMDTCWALEPEEVERGYVLTCQSHPTSDTVILDYDA